MNFIDFLVFIALSYILTYVFSNYLCKGFRSATLLSSIFLQEFTCATSHRGGPFKCLYKAIHPGRYIEQLIQLNRKFGCL